MTAEARGQHVPGFQRGVPCWESGAKLAQAAVWRPVQRLLTRCSFPWARPRWKTAGVDMVAFVPRSRGMCQQWENTTYIFSIDHGFEQLETVFLNPAPLSLGMTRDRRRRPCAFWLWEVQD